MGGAFRRSELVGIDVEHVREVSRGLEIRIPFAKTDQEGRGATVVIPNAKRIAPVALYKEWIARAGIVDGPVFRKLSPAGTLTPKRMSDKGVAPVVKARAAAAGYDPALFSGHSLRAGFLPNARHAVVLEPAKARVAAGVIERVEGAACHRSAELA